MVFTSAHPRHFRRLGNRARWARRLSRVSMGLPVDTNFVSSRRRRAARRPPNLAERGVISQEYEKSIAHEEACFQTDCRCERKELQTLVVRKGLAPPRRRKPINPLSLGHTYEQTLHGCVLGHKFDQIKSSHHIGTPFGRRHVCVGAVTQCGASAPRNRRWIPPASQSHRGTHRRVSCAPDISNIARSADAPFFCSLHGETPSRRSSVDSMNVC